MATACLQRGESLVWLVPPPPRRRDRVSGRKDGWNETRESENPSVRRTSGERGRGLPTEWNAYNPTHVLLLMVISPTSLFVPSIYFQSIGFTIA